MAFARTLAGLGILVVEDDTDTRELYRGMLSAAGATVRCAVSADAALEVLATWRPDAILCDLHLPTTDGCSLLHEIRAAGFEDLPVISISGGHPAIETARSREAGFARHLVKPSKLADIIAALAPR